MRIGPKVLGNTGVNKAIGHHTPLGVVAAITPWRFPLILPISKLRPTRKSG
ncbi:MAG TPA: aldehyde dehydrogenase family protein [Sphingobium sp.]|nr:aldehyde dehydrogenase family protein [Sphingobium sp.]